MDQTNSQNGYLLTLFITLGFGGVFASLFYYIASIIGEAIKRRIIVSVTIDSNDQNYKWMLQYLRDKGFLGKSMNNSEVKVVPRRLQWWQEITQNTFKLNVEYFPAPGSHYFVYKGKKFWASQIENKTQLIGWEQIPEK